MEEFDNEEENGEGWLVSYADMMTLIACFFILMMAFANYDPVGFNIKAEQLSKSFRIAKNKSSEVKLKDIREEIARHEIKDRTKVSLKDSELVIKFSSSVLFQNGEYKLSEDALETLDALIDIVKTTNPNYRILVEGHADDDFEDETYDNLSISLMRASTVANRFIYFGFPKKMVVPIGRGDADPLMTYESDDPEKDELRKLNRRVVLRLLEPITPKKVKFGLGIYFKDAVEDPSNDPLKNNSVEGIEVEEN